MIMEGLEELEFGDQPFPEKQLNTAHYNLIPDGRAVMRIHQSAIRAANLQVSAASSLPKLFTLAPPRRTVQFFIHYIFSLRYPTWDSHSPLLPRHSKPSLSTSGISRIQLPWHSHPLFITDA